MGKIKIHAGDFKKNSNTMFSRSFGQDLFRLYTAEHPLVGEAINIDQVEELDVASEESVNRIGGMVGWGVAGGVLLGPLGALGGALLGSKGKNINFICRFKDGRMLLGETDSKTYTQMQGALMDASVKPQKNRIIAKMEADLTEAAAKRHGVDYSDVKPLSLAMAPENSVFDFVSIGNILFILLALTNIAQGKTLPAIVFCGGAVILTPLVNREISRKENPESNGFPFFLRFLIGVGVFLMGIILASI